MFKPLSKDVLLTRAVISSSFFVEGHLLSGDPGVSSNKTSSNPTETDKSRGSAGAGSGWN